LVGLHAAARERAAVVDPVDREGDRQVEVAGAQEVAVHRVRVLRCRDGGGRGDHALRDDLAAVDAPGRDRVGSADENIFARSGAGIFELKNLQHHVNGLVQIDLEGHVPSLGTMSERLVMADSESARDVLTFAGRAARAGEDGVRLQAAGGTLVMTAAALAPKGLLDRTPTVLAMRMLHADPELECDFVVASLEKDEDPRNLVLPDEAISPAWAGIAPPRGGWEHAGEIEASTLANRAQWGIAAVAHQVPDNPGED